MVSPGLQRALEELGSLRNAPEGLPISSHRAGVGPLVVGSKRLLRWLLQPLINEVLRKQARFNEELVIVLRSVILDLKSLQDGELEAHGELEERLRAIEKNVERLAGAAARGAATFPSLTR